MPDNLGLMEWATYLRVISECAFNDCPSIKLNWRGEPLIHPLLGEMVRFAKNMGIMEVQINTNGLLLTKRKTDELCDAGLDRIIISIDGMTKKTYESIRIGASWDRLIDNLDYLISLKKRPKIRIQTCELPENSDELLNYDEFWMRYADDVIIHQSFDPLRKKNNSLARKKKKHCPQLWQRLVVAWNGDIHPCCVDWSSKGILGNIKNVSLKQVWNGLQERQLRVAHKLKIAGLYQPCKECDNYLI